MVRIALRLLAKYPASIIATFIALWLAIIVVTACGVMLESGIRYHGDVRRYAAAPVLVAGTTIRTTEGSGEDRSIDSEPLAERLSLDLALRNSIAQAPGVRAAIADIAIPSQAITPNGLQQVEIHPWSAAQLAPFRVTSGSAPSYANNIVVDQALATASKLRVGQNIQLAMPGGVQVYTISGIASPAAGEPTTATVFMPDTTVMAFTHNKVQVVGIFGETGVATSQLVSAVQKALPSVPSTPSGSYPEAYSGADRGYVESLDASNGSAFIISVSSVFGACALLIAIIVIAGTIGLSVQQRQRDIALLRAIAATPWQIRWMVLAQVAVLGLCSGILGIWPGIAGATWLRNQFIARDIVPASFLIHVSVLPPLVAMVAVLLIGLLAAWIASRRASRVRPTEALAESAIDRGGLGFVRVLFGLVMLAGGIVLAYVSANATGDEAAGVSFAVVFVFVIAAGLLSPLVIRVIAGTVGRLLYLAGTTGRLAAAVTYISASRLGVVVSSVILVVAMSGSLWFIQTTEVHAAAQQAQAGLVADYVVSSPGGLQPSVVQELAHVPGVAAATGVIHSTLFTNQGGVSSTSIQGVDVQGLTETVNLDVTSGSLAQLHRSTIALDTLTAQAVHVHVGNTLPVWFGDGRSTKLTVVAIYRRGLGFASTTVSRELLAAHTTSGLDDVVYLATTNHQPLPVTTRQAILRLAPGSLTLPKSVYQVRLGKDLAQNAWTIQVIVGILLVYVVIGAVNTLTTYALGRRRELAILRLSGATRMQILRMIGWEQMLLLGMALALGAAIAAATLIPMVKGTTGSSIPYIPTVGWMSVIGGVIVLGTVTTIFSVLYALHLRPVDAVGARE